MNLKKIVIIFLFFFHNNCFAENTTRFIDIDYLFENSNLGKEVTSNLKKIHLQNIENLEKEKIKLINKEKELKKTQKIISKDEFNKKISKLRKEANLFNKNKEETIQNFKKKKNNDLKVFFDKINPILHEYMNNESINLLIEKKNIFIGKSSHDITLPILEIINKEFK